LNISAVHNLIAAFFFASISGKAFWAYAAGVVVLSAGIFPRREEVLRASGLNRFVALGPIFFAVPMAVFASQHFTEAKGVSTIVPSWLPWSLFWTYFVGAAIIAASLSIAAMKHARLAALLLAALLIVFVLSIHIPRIVANMRDVPTWAVACRDLAFSGGALALAGSEIEGYANRHLAGLVALARIVVAVPTIFFGAVHFFHPEYLPAIDFDRSLPTWIPGLMFWSYFAGAVFLFAGTCLLINWKARMAATWLGIGVLVVLVFVYLPMLAVHPLDIDNGLNYFVSTLAFAGTALVLARAMPEDI
jgi:uncharacterized membrane protein